LNHFQYFFTLLLVATFLSCNKQASEQTTSDQPLNVILIMTDDQGYGDLGSTGNPYIQTPHLDKFSKESVSFTNFHVGTTCAPTRAGLMSGMHCNRVGAWHTVNGRSFLGTSFPTIASYLKKGGYQTGIFGKWHLGDNYPFRPQDRGFDEVIIHGGGGVGQTPDFWNNDYYDDTYFHNGKAEKYEGYCTDVWFDEALKFIKGNAAKKDKPFFCYISTNSPHGPHHIPQKYIDIYKDNEQVPNPNFYGQITNIDDNFGKLEKELAASGLLENTILIFMTDNGTAAGASFDKNQLAAKGYNANMRGQKGSEYEGGHRVPLFIRFPENTSIKNNSFDQLISYTDLLPTLLDILGLEQKSKKFDGMSIVPLLKDGQQAPLADRIVITDTQRNAFPQKWKNAAVMQNQWRLINNKELYNLETDPGQQQNIIEDHKDIAERLSKGYESWWASIQEDILIENRIILGSKIENPTLLTSHDWHTNEDPPWHQRHIRAGKINNGTWWLDVESDGQYRVRLYRWPPSLNQAFKNEINEGDKIEGGQPYLKGLGLNFNRAKIKLQNQSLESSKAIDDTYFEFLLDLKKGKADLDTWIYDEKDAVRGAYYVALEKMS